MEEIRVLSPTAILGYGYPRASLEEGMRRRPHVIAVDGGSTDGGPYYLGIEPGGGGDASAFIEMLSRDVGPLLEAAAAARIPLIAGSAGFAGAELHLQATVMVVRNLAERMGLHFRMAVIHAEIEKEYVKARLREGKVSPLGPVPELTEDEIEASVRIVGQMGVEPFIEALEADAQVIVAGRANDPSMFAALPFVEKFDKGLSLHMAKILECAAIAAEPGSGSDAMIGTLRGDHFLVEPLNPERVCSITSVAAHSLYEKSDPLHLYGPGGMVDLSAVRFEQHDGRTVRVSGSRYVPDSAYKIKLEGSKR
ncbi:MAG: acyclic terpene utilization AtuA family protein, partial [Candidatus Hydrogenedentota bacterium]